VNYYSARKRGNDNRWDWTCMNDGRIWKSPPCTEHEDGHATEEEAQRHFYDHELSRLRETTTGDDVRVKCEYQPCDGLTSHGLVGIRYFTTPIYLCETHRNRSIVAKLYPFEEGIEIWASW
jgi:hypothetical protein